MRQVRFREDRSRQGYFPAFHKTPLEPSDDLYIHSFVRNLSPGSSNLHFKMAFPFSAQDCCMSSTPGKGALSA